MGSKRRSSGQKKLCPKDKCVGEMGDFWIEKLGVIVEVGELLTAGGRPV